MKKETRTFKTKDFILPPEGQFQFGESNTNANDGTVQTPVKLVVRTNKPVDSCFFGRIVHDLKGVFHKAKIILDWRHNNDEQVGYLDKINVSHEQIECSGQVVSIEPNDRASKIVQQARAGMPFESSIFFAGSGIELEEVPDKKSTDVNGTKFDGPGLVIRKWPLRGVAICPYGRDANTSVQFNENETLSALVFCQEEENTMSEDAKSTDDVDKASLDDKLDSLNDNLDSLSEKLEDQDDTDDSKLKLPTSPDGVLGKNFIEAYGQDGAVWFAEGKTFVEAQALYVTKLQERVEELETRLTAAGKDSGGEEAVDSEDADEDAGKMEVVKKEKDLTNKVGPKLAKFAACVKLPK